MGLPYPTRSANDPPLVKEVVGESGHPLNCHFIGSNLIPPYRPTSWMRPTNGKTDLLLYIYIINL